MALPKVLLFVCFFNIRSFWAFWRRLSMPIIRFILSSFLKLPPQVNFHLLTCRSFFMSSVMSKKLFWDRCDLWSVFTTYSHICWDRRALWCLSNVLIDSTAEETEDWNFYNLNHRAARQLHCPPHKDAQECLRLHYDNHLSWETSWTIQETRGTTAFPIHTPTLTASLPAT